jgi:hypothetical protein
MSEEAEQPQQQQLQRIRVGIRVRPLTSSEVATGQTCSWAVHGQSITQIETDHKSGNKRRNAEFRWMQAYPAHMDAFRLFTTLGFKMFSGLIKRQKLFMMRWWLQLLMTVYLA